MAMARAIGAVCCFTVGLQILIGVPIVVCVAFFLLTGNGGIGPLAVEVHGGPHSAPHVILHGPSAPTPPALAIAPPPNMIPPSPSVSFDNPILATRAEQGSPLAGTVLSEGTGPSDEQSLFVAAFEKVAAERTSQQATKFPGSEPPTNADPAAATANSQSDPSSRRKHADDFAVDHLYAMANMDERAGEYDRADQWRSLAREIRRKSTPAESANPPASDSLSEALGPALSPY